MYSVCNGLTTYKRVVWYSCGWWFSFNLVKTSIYRVEDWKGAGPYDSHKHRGLHQMNTEHKGNRPSPAADGIARLLSSEVCGFQDREALDWWFQNHKRSLYQHGFNIAVYVVASHLIRYGQRQLVFERKGLVPVDRLPMIRGGKVIR